MNRRVAWVAVASVALVGVVVGTQLVASRDAAAQGPAGRLLNLLRASPVQNLKQGALLRAHLRTKVVDGSARHSVFLTGTQMICEIHTASFADAAALYEQIWSDPTANVNCYGETIPGPEPTTMFMDVKLAPRPNDGHGVFVESR